MKVVLSFNSWELSWSISLEQSSRLNTTKYNIDPKIRNGKITVTLTPKGDPSEFIYLNIWKTLPDVDEHFELQNYAFKYINVEKEEDYVDFAIYNDVPRINYTQNKKKI